MYKIFQLLHLTKSHIHEVILYLSIFWLSLVLTQLPCTCTMSPFLSLFFPTISVSPIMSDTDPSHFFSTALILCFCWILSSQIILPTPSGVDSIPLSTFVNYLRLNLQSMGWMECRRGPSGTVCHQPFWTLVVLGFSRAHRHTVLYVWLVRTLVKCVVINESFANVTNLYSTTLKIACCQFIRNPAVNSVNRCLSAMCSRTIILF